MNGTYRVRVYMVDVDKSRARQLREVLGRFVRGAGKQPLREMMQRAFNGERVLIYETNSDDDARAVAQSATDGGATVEIEGLQPPKAPF